MLDAGMIPYTRMGERSYRFLRLSDVTDYCLSSNKSACRHQLI